jgi:hypothetical protein
MGSTSAGDDGPPASDEREADAMRAAAQSQQYPRLEILLPNVGDPPAARGHR